MWVEDRKGQKVYVTFVPDCDENEGGLYCETYTDDRCDNKIDDFCIHVGDCEMTREGIESYIAEYYKDEVLDLNYKFDGVSEKKVYQVTLETKVVRTYTILANSADEAISIAYDDEDDYDDEEIYNDSYAEKQ